MEEKYIIDGVDVSKCFYFRKEALFSGTGYYEDGCAEYSASSCKGRPCAFKCIEYAKAYKKLYKYFRSHL